MVGVGQGLLPGLGGRLLLAVAVQHLGQHGERVAVLAVGAAGRRPAGWAARRS